MILPEAERECLLIVDDTEENIEFLSIFLDDYNRLSATTGEVALAKACGEPKPDLILLDVMMPGMDGFEVCRRLKSNPATKDIPVIFVTTLGGAHDETQGFELGAVDYIHKPFKPAVVRARVKTHLELRHARRLLADHNQVLERKIAERTVLLRRAFEKIKKSSLETIVRLSKAAEFRDVDTGAHVMRMSHYAQVVAREMGQSERMCEALLRAVPMHDVGKIGIPDRILLKSGALDGDEWDVMRGHCTMGAKILADSDAEVISLAEVVALTHHEKWDGSGYPCQLRGKEIPLAGRITAVADVFDALTSKRPYKEAYSLDRSREIIKEGRGIHFDPDVVDAFLAAEDKIISIKNRFDDGVEHLLFALAR